MAKRFIPKTSIMSEVKNYLMIAIGLAFYAFAWNFFMAPYTFVTGGVTGICAIIQYTTGVPIQFSYFAINIVLILIAIWQLGLRFCLKTLYAITVLTLFLQLFQMVFAVYPNASDILGADKQLESCIVGSIFTGLGLAFCFISNGSSGGVDIIAAIVNKYKDVSFGRAILYVDACIVISSFFIIPTENTALSLQKVFYGFINLVVVNVSLDYVVNSNRQTVQFFIFSSKYDDIAYYITRHLRRGVTLLDSIGYYSGKESKVVTTITRASQANKLLSAIKQIDPNALVSQSKVMAVYGLGFDKIKAKAKAVPMKTENDVNPVEENKG